MKPMSIAAIAMGAILASCVYDAQVEPVAGNSPLAQDRDAPQLALLDRVLSDYFASDIVNPPTICVAVIENGQTSALPPEQEVALIERHSSLAPFGRCRWNGQSYVDSITEQPALLFTIHSFECEGPTRCSGWAGYVSGATSSLSARYTMEFTGDRWTFERDLRLIAD